MNCMQLPLTRLSPVDVCSRSQQGINAVTTQIVAGATIGSTDGDGISISKEVGVESFDGESIVDREGITVGTSGCWSSSGTPSDLGQGSGDSLVKERNVERAGSRLSKGFRISVTGSGGDGNCVGYTHRISLRGLRKLERRTVLLGKGEQVCLGKRDSLWGYCGGSVLGKSGTFGSQSTNVIVSKRIGRSSGFSDGIELENRILIRS
mmetsp:Transcript_9389/g.17527  ORF Transcript_9389/g.17527 Transcript_9389/m.17527 type:complete len:207 (-) Transcript_9389:216-836(-)